MALNTGTENDTTKPHAGGGMNQGGQTQQPDREIPTNPSAMNFDTSLGFGGRELFTMASNLGSEYINKLAQEMLEAYRGLPNGDRPKVSILDKDVINNLAYSSLVVHMKNEQFVNYYIILLEGTGREPMTADAIIAEVNSAQRPGGQQPFVYTTGDAIDSVLHEEVQAALIAEYGESTNLRPVDAVVVPHTQHETAQIAVRLAAMGFNACRTDAAIATGQLKDFNIVSAKQKSPNTILKLETNMLKQTVNDEVDNPVRSDFIVELNAIDASQQIQSLNLQNSKNTIARVSGFIDAIPEEIQVLTQPGMPTMTNIRLHPHMVITNNAVQTPTPGNMLLGVISSLVMTNQNMWLASVMPSDNRKGVRNIGSLNLLTNLENNQNGIGEALDLTGKKITADESYALIKQMFTLSPIVSYDIESFGSQTFYTSSLAIAAQPGNGAAKIEASREIIDTAKWLTNGNFPSDFPANEIFVNSGIVIPLGRWSDKSGERDIRDVDAAFIATQTQDVGLINKWVLSGLPREASGMDPYITKVDLISKLIPGAVITGKAVRVTFSAKFINTLINAAMGAGLDARYEPEIKFVETNNLAMVGNYMAGAGLDGGASGFAKQQMNNAPLYATPYSTNGATRY